MNISLHWAIAWVLFGVGQFPSMTHGQDPILDSLLEIRTHVETDEELLKSLLQIGSRLGWSDQERAESYVDSAIALATDLRDLSQLGYALLQKYDLEVHTGKKVLVSLDEIQSLFDQTGDQLGVAKVYSQRAFTAETAGDFVEAMRFQTQSRQIYLELGAELELHNANVDLAGLLQSLDNHEEALAYLDQSEDYIHRNGSTENIAYFHLIKADALKRLERYDEALEENKFLREYALKHGYMADVITSGTCIGDIYMDRGDLASAEEWYEQAWADARIYEHPYHLAYVRSGLGELAIKRGEYEEAIEHFESMLTVMNSPDSRYFMNSNWRLMAKAYRGVGNMEEAY
nr:tetratricopeptide repeat protein [Saprospiraceae bacterium]